MLLSRDTVKQDGRLVRLAHRMVVVRDLDYLHSIDDANAKDGRERGWPRYKAIWAQNGKSQKVAESMLATQHLRRP